MFGFLADRARAGRVASGVKEVTSKLRVKAPSELAGVALATNMMRLQFQGEGMPEFVFRWPDKVSAADQIFRELATANAECRAVALNIRKLLVATPRVDGRAAECVLGHYLDLQLGIEILQLTVGCGLTPKLRPQVRPLWIKIAWSTWAMEIGRYIDDLQRAIIQTAGAFDAKTDVDAAISAMRELSRSGEMNFFPDFLER